MVRLRGMETDSLVVATRSVEDDVSESFVRRAVVLGPDAV